jgi:hypothetical protein
VRLRDKGKLRHLIEFKNIEIRDLADRAAVPESLIWHLLRDPSYKTSRNTCSSETARRIERELGVDPGSLFEPELLTVASHSQLNELRDWLLDEPARKRRTARAKVGARR